MRVLKLGPRKGSGMGRPGSVFISVCGDGRYEGTLDNAVTSSRPPGVIDMNVPNGEGVSTGLVVLVFEGEVMLDRMPSIVRGVGDVNCPD